MPFIVYLRLVLTAVYTMIGNMCSHSRSLLRPLALLHTNMILFLGPFNLKCYWDYTVSVGWAHSRSIEVYLVAVTLFLSYLALRTLPSRQIPTVQVGSFETRAFKVVAAFN